MKNESPISELLRSRVLEELKIEKSTKRSALRIALAGAIYDGVLQPNQRLPPEVELAETTGLSLGTVQSALGQLKDMGLIARRRGDGTRVVDADRIDPSVWHFRFRVRGTSKPLRLIHQEIQVQTTAVEGPWSEHLGKDKKYVVLKRAIIGTDGIPIGAKMYLDESMTSSDQFNPREFMLTNIRTVLEKRLGITSMQVSHEVFLVSLSNEDCHDFAMLAGRECFEIIARTTTSTGRPFYYQRILVPAESISLIF